jgi:uncharacterized membrane protein (UPF0127 family)
MALRLKYFVVSLLISFFSTQGLAFTANDKVDFKKIPATMGSKKITIELAENDRQHEHGLMFRKKLNSNEGMLFIFDNEETRTFWMKNTLINLSIAYLDKNRKIVDIQEMKAMNTIMEKPPTYPSKSPAMYALEMPEGWFKKNKIKEGDQLQYSR